MKNFRNWFVYGLATVAFLAPWKFGSPVILQSFVSPPTGIAEWLYFSWPNELGVLLIFTAFLWLVLDRERMLARVDLLFVLPLFFLLTQALAVPNTICRQATFDTLMLFAECVLLFYVGAWYVRDGAAVANIFGGLSLASLFVCVLAMEQYFGGLQRTREYVAMYVDTSRLPKDYLLRMTSNRVFGSLAYPNALAGFLVLAFAPTLAWIWVRSRGWHPAVKWLALIFAGGAMVFCLVLTGSRGGFVAFAVMALTSLWCSVPRKRWVGGLVVFLVVVFLLGLRGGFLHVGTKSLEARTDYWRGAIAIIKDHPWVGTGPGTFGSIYTKYKTALTEEARAAHNNYLQMWSDSGVLAFVAFAVLWIVGARDAYRVVRRRAGDAAAIAICGALAGWAVHGLVDFDLYVPGVALPAFILLGAVQGLKELPRTDSVPPQRRKNWVVGAFCTVVLAAIWWFEGRALAASFEQGRARELGRSNLWAAFERTKRSAELAPWNPQYQSSVGDIALLLGKTDEALAAYHGAIEKDRYRAALWERLAEAQLTTHGVDAEALKLLRKAVELNPTNPRYQQALADAEESVRQSPPPLLQSVPAKETDSTSD